MSIPTDTNRRIWSEFVLDYVDARVRRILDLLPRPGSGARYLDIGCSAGTTTRLCAERMGVDSVHGVDVANFEAAKENGVEVLDHDLNSGAPLPWPDGGFAVITCLETLEHLPDPDAVLAEIHRLLAPGGRALVDVPRLDSWMNVLLLTLGFQPPGVECSSRRRYGAINEESMLTGHAAYFTRRAFLEMLTFHGFEIELVAEVSQGDNWLAVQKKMGREVSLFARLAWRVYDLLPWKKDYMIVRLRLGSLATDGGVTG